MSTHNIGFYEEISKIIFELSSNTHLISSADTGFRVTSKVENGLSKNTLRHAEKRNPEPKKKRREKKKVFFTSYITRAHENNATSHSHTFWQCHF